MKRTFITPLLLPLIISSSLIGANKGYAVEKNVSSARLKASIDIASIICHRDTFGEDSFKESYEESYGEAYKNIIKRHDKDNSLRIKEFVNSESGKKVIDSFTSYNKNWSNCDKSGNIKKNKKYNTSGKTANELMNIYVLPVWPLLKVDLDKEKKSSSKNSSPKTKAKDKARKKCLKAKDYSGCMEYEMSN